MTEREQADRKITGDTDLPAHWQRLVDDLTGQPWAQGPDGVRPRVDRTAFQQMHYGRIESGVTIHVRYLLPGRGLVDVHERFGRGGKWYGWGVTREDSEGIVLQTWRTTTKRSEVVAAVKEALSRWTYRNACH